MGLLKILTETAEVTIMKNEAPDYSKQRSAFRWHVGAAEPVYLLFSIDTENIDPIVDELGAGGARFYASNHYQNFYKGQVLGPAVLVLPDVGMPVVYPVVKWMSYPTIGVEFAELDYSDREMIFQFMFRTERKIVQIEKNKSVDDRIE
jgi:hypothetical protein